MVTKLDRLARSLPDARTIAEDLTRRKVRLSLGGSVYDPTDPVERLLFNVLAMVAEFEADLIRSRTREGMRVAKAKGHLRGKQPKLNPRQEAHLVELLRTGEYTTAELGDLFGVARSTVYRAVARSKQAALAIRPPTSALACREAPRSGAHLSPLRATTTTYRPRHGAPSDFQSENRSRQRAQEHRPEPIPYQNWMVNRALHLAASVRATGCLQERAVVSMNTRAQLAPTWLICARQPGRRARRQARANRRSGFLSTQ